MSIRTSATRYAKALLEVAVQESDPAKVEQDLAAVARAMGASAELRRALTSPGIPQQIRVNVTAALTSHMGVQPPVAKLLKMLAERGRLDLVPIMSDVYTERLLAHRNIVRATVTSAAPLTSEKKQRLEASLSGMTGKKVQLETAVDSSIIGGLVARIGSTVYDGSIRTQLQKMKQQLVETA
ncbi:MAG TPA: ATP synthase F1 subunit delta [Vicinamibacterales bacterium]|nr:ATP synthase F1 subunit delta [Vicinamibacterales bacterium]